MVTASHVTSSLARDSHCNTATARALEGSIWCTVDWVRYMPLVQTINYIQDIFKFESRTSHDSYVTMMDFRIQKKIMLYKSQTGWKMIFSPHERNWWPATMDCHVLLLRTSPEAMKQPGTLLMCPDIVSHFGQCPKTTACGIPISSVLFNILDACVFLNYVFWSQFSISLCHVFHPLKHLIYLNERWYGKS